MKLSENLSQSWLMIPENLFPWPQKERGSLTEKQQQLITVFELSRVEEFIKILDRFSSLYPSLPITKLIYIKII